MSAGERSIGGGDRSTEFKISEIGIRSGRAAGRFPSASSREGLTTISRAMDATDSDRFKGRIGAIRAETSGAIEDKNEEIGDGENGEYHERFGKGTDS